MVVGVTELIGNSHFLGSIDYTSTLSWLGSFSSWNADGVLARRAKLVVFLLEYYADAVRTLLSEITLLSADDSPCQPIA